MQFDRNSMDRALISVLVCFPTIGMMDTVARIASHEVWLFVYS